MNRMLLMVRKDLLRQLRSPMAALFVLSFPVVFATLLTLAFGGGEPSVKIDLLVEDRDDSIVSQFLLGALAHEQAAQYIDVTQVTEGGLGRIERNEASALLIIPEDFGKDLVEGHLVTFELIRNPAQGILPEIAEQGMQVLTELLSAASQVLREPLDGLAPLLADDATEVDATQVAELSVAFHTAIDGIAENVFPPVITLSVVDLANEAEAQDTSSGNIPIFVIVLPGISVWALFMLGDMAMRDIMTESTLGTLTRQLSGPVSTWQLVAGKALYTAALASISLMILAAIGAVFVDGPIDLMGFATLSACVVAAVTGFAAILYGLARSERQGATIGGVLMLIFAFLGGSFIQIDSLPSSLRKLAPISPFYWGTTGYRALLQGGGLADVLPPAGVLLAIGIVGLTAGSLLLGRRARSGAVA